MWFPFSSSFFPERFFSWQPSIRYHFYITNPNVTIASRPHDFVYKVKDQSYSGNISTPLNKSEFTNSPNWSIYVCIGTHACIWTHIIAIQIWNLLLYDKLFSVLCTCFTCAALCLALAYTSFNNLIYNTYNFKRTPAMPDVYIPVAPVWSHR